MKLEAGNKVRLIYNDPERNLGLKPGMEGVVRKWSYAIDSTLYYSVKWPCGTWWVPHNQIKVIKS